MLDEEAPKIYGLNSVDEKLPVYVVEGPFDSTFVNNSVALCGSDGDVRCLEEAVLFLFTIMSPAIEKSSIALANAYQEAKASSSGQAES